MSCLPNIPAKRIHPNYGGVTVEPIRKLPHTSIPCNKTNPILKNLDVDLLKKTLLPPTITANLTNTEQFEFTHSQGTERDSESRELEQDLLGLKLYYEDTINVDVFALFQSSLGMTTESSQYSYYYDLILDFENFYQLVLYISFDIKDTKDDDELPTKKSFFDVFHFGLKFSEEAFKHFAPPGSKAHIAMEQIKTVKVFLVDSNSHVKMNRGHKSAITSVVNEKTLVIPGIEINKDCENPRVMTPQKLEQEASKYVRSKIFKDRLLAPIPFVTRSRRKNKLTITSVALIKNMLNLGVDDFTFYYNLKLDTHDKDLRYKLIWYITYEQDSIKNEPANHEKKVIFDSFLFQVEFDVAIQFKLPFSKSDDKTNTLIALDQISSVEVFVVDRDPETSRGTETVVQDDDD
jgi:hypothetical protein